MNGRPRLPILRRDTEARSEGDVMSKLVSIFLGIAVAGLLLTSVFLAESANSAKRDAEEALARVEGGAAAQAAEGGEPAADGGGTEAGDAAVAVSAHAHETAGALESFAGAAPDNAAELAAAHEPYPAELPPVPEGDVANVEITLKDVTVEIAPGVRYQAWGFEGGAPGPVIHVREGQTVNVTLVNGGAIPHSVDFHAARIAPNTAFKDVAPGESFSFSFVATDPGVFMYHCGTKPVLAHIANGMYGAIVVDPAKPLPKADREYVLVSSEWYLTGPGLDEPASYNATKAHAMTPDWVTWNGYAGQYVAHPLPADPGDVVRFYVVAAGPSLDTAFHVVGTIFDRAWVDGDVTRYEQGVQTVDVPAGGGGIFDVKIDEPGFYPFVSHSFASVDLGQVGLLQVGHPKGSASH
jgi:nitrite reductase (NO-forming)